MNHGARCDCPVCRDRYRQGGTLASHDFSGAVCAGLVFAALFAAVAFAISLLVS